MDTDDPTALSSIENRSKEEEDGGSLSNAVQRQQGATTTPGGGGGGNNMKRIASIEKFQKSAQNTFRRFRSWSQGGGGNGGNGGLTSSETTSAYEGGGGGGKSSRSMSMNSPPPSSSNRKSLTPATPGLNPTPTKHNPHHHSSNNNNNNPSTSSSQQPTDEPYLDEDELTPLIYGYLHKLGRNGHWQKRFFETNGERLTYYKSGKRKKVLATLDLYKVSLCLFVSLIDCV